jgi:hypothetical protein
MGHVDLTVSLVGFESFINTHILCSIINGTGGSVLAFTYFPKRGSDSGLSKKEILGRIDYVGGFLSIAGLTLLLVICCSNVLVGEVQLTFKIA